MVSLEMIEDEGSYGHAEGTGQTLEGEEGEKGCRSFWGSVAPASGLRRRWITLSHSLSYTHHEDMTSNLVGDGV